MHIFDKESKRYPHTVTSRSAPRPSVQTSRQETHSVLHLQRSIGNRALQRMLDAEEPVNAGREEMQGTPESAGPGMAQSLDNEDNPPTATPPTTTPPTVTPPLAPGPVVGLNISVPNHIRAGSTPAGMPDRLPPRVDTPAAITVTGWHPPWEVVRISVEGAGGGNGTLTLNGANHVDLTNSATVQLRGVNQTTPGNAGNLRLVAQQGTVRVAQSHAFSVSSVPQNWATSYVRSFTGSEGIGMVARNAWESDSGDVNDLDEVRRKEQVEVTAATGPYAGATQGVSGWRDATLGAIHDHHRDAPRSAFRAAGSKIAKQVFIFKCDRTGVTDIPATNSGLLISRVITDAGGGVFNFDISKVGQGVTANGFTSAAASGSAVAPTQVV